MGISTGEGAVTSLACRTGEKVGYPETKATWLVGEAVGQQQPWEEHRRPHDHPPLRTED